MIFGKAFKISEDGVPRTTPSGRPMLGIAHASEIRKGPDEMPRSFWVVASTESIDRDGDVIRQRGWDFKNFRKNPVGLWSHNYREPAIFTVPKVKVEGANTMALVNFPEGLSSLSDSIFRGYDMDVLKSFSVGFDPSETNQDPKRREEYGLPPEADWGNGILFWKQELLELSAVNVPANPEALAKMKGAGVDTRPLEEMMQHADGFVIELHEEDFTKGDNADPDPAQADDPVTVALTFTGLEDKGPIDPDTLVEMLEEVVDIEELGPVTITYYTDGKDTPDTSVTKSHDDKPEPVPPEGEQEENGDDELSGEIPITLEDDELNIEVEDAPEPAEARSLFEDSELVDDLNKVLSEAATKKALKIFEQRLNFRLGIIPEEET